MGERARLEKCENVDIRAEALAELAILPWRKVIDLTVVGPEVPLAAGVTDLFEAAGLRVFGPSQTAAQLEAQRVFKNLWCVMGFPWRRLKFYRF
ncbi:MAG: hypothetical protein R3A44_34280 [Caldilineaceae bacterium]